MSDLFVEIFPVETPPSIHVYRLALTTESPRLALRVAARLRRTPGGFWIWSGEWLLSDSLRGEGDLAFLREEYPEIEVLALAPEVDLPPKTVADFVIRTQLRELDEQIKAALVRSGTRIRHATVAREHRLQPWDVAGQPSVSISIASRLLYDRSIAQFVQGQDPDEKLLGLWATDSAGNRGEIVKVVEGGVDPILRLQLRRDERDFSASDLRLIVRLPQIRHYDVDVRQATQALQMSPATRAQHVRTVSDIPKEVGILASAYNARTHPDAFFSADFEMNLRFDENRVRPYNADTLPYDFAKCGVYRLRPEFKKTPVRVCVVNTLTLKLEDFVEALQRQLDRSFDFQIEVVRERRVRVVSRSNLESAVRVVEKENPDIILAFFPDDIGTDEDDESDGDASAAYVRSLTLGRALPIHVIYESTLDDPEAMPAIIMGILGKTGSSPFVLTEPLEHADFVVGLDVVREVRDDQQNFTAIARIYQADGTFLRYIIRDLTVDSEQLPYPLLRDLFPQREFSGKRVVIHHDGALWEDLLTALMVWGQAIKAAFLPVEIIRFGAPRIYAIDNGVVQPPWGSAFKLSDSEALLISSLPKDDITPQPLHIRTVNAGHPPLAIDKALRGVLVWTLLAYGAERLPKLPVTVLNADHLSDWLRKGGRFQANEGQVAFWL